MEILFKKFKDDCKQKVSTHQFGLFDFEIRKLNVITSCQQCSNVVITNRTAGIS